LRDWTVTGRVLLLPMNSDANSVAGSVLYQLYPQVHCAGTQQVRRADIGGGLGDELVV